MFTYFQDRDGKFQLNSLAESGFDPLSRTCNFMLTEEAHHMFVGESGVGRVVERSIELIKEHDTLDIRKHGGIDLATIQKWINFHFSICLDLFGQEKSTNAANFYNMGLKGRFQEMKINDDHQLDNDVYMVPEIEGNRVIISETGALGSINERLRNDYRDDCQRGVDRWNKMIASAEIDFKLSLPHSAFHRNIGVFADINADVDGNIISEEKWNADRNNWIPTAKDRTFVESLMTPVTEVGKIAGWIAPPARGIQGKEPNFEYVKFH
jgi:benzoyl-CoA 2,3-dioxygenase component B